MFLAQVCGEHGLRFAIVFSRIENGAQNPVDKWVNSPTEFLE
jgi:hypothetical protein